MNAAASRTSTHTRTADSPRRTPAQQWQRPRPMPRSTTRVIWTRSEGPIVHYGDIA